ncbi:MAG: PVC-type heme-binding CxxCH protein [Verrucomicrobiota bacterium]|nr:PVC-type heme-binding CxxCH protein [Verrucomicrobiota bacterium]
MKPLPFCGPLITLAIWSIASILDNSNSQAQLSREGNDLQPLEPEEALETIYLPEGFTVDLIAAEPLTKDPVAFDWGLNGRLWVVEMADYPYGMDGNGQAGGRVRILEDRDADGKMDYSSLFAEGLNFPNGLLIWRDGVIVTAAPDILFLRDTDGDGKADSKEVLISGLGEGNQQLRANGLRWGLNGWVYVASGGHRSNYGTDTFLRSSRSGIEIKMGSRDFRFKPDTGELEPQSGPTQFGRNRDDWGRWFGTQNSRPLWHYVLPDQYIRRNPHYSPSETCVLAIDEINPPVGPAKRPQKRYHSFEHESRYTSACSGMVYRDSFLFPSSKINAFACEPFQSLVQRIELSPDGPTFAGKRVPAEEGLDFFASSDRWCRPVMIRTGPDGALWVADMYRYIIEHPQWLTEEGRIELLPYYRDGENRGRIYRVRQKGINPGSLPRLAGADPVDLLNSSNGWMRDKAQQMILWRNSAELAPRLRQLVRESDQAVARLQALWTLHGLNALSSDLLITALSDPHPGVRENALRLAESNPDPQVIKAALKLSEDPEIRVQFQLTLSLGAFEDSPQIPSLLAKSLSSQDPWFEAAAFSSLLPHFAEVVAGLDSETYRRLHRPLAQMALGSSDHNAFGQLLSRAWGSPAIILSLLDLLQERDLTVDDFDNPSLNSQYTKAISQARDSMDSGSAPIAKRIEAAALLTRIPRENERAYAFLGNLIDPALSPETTDRVLDTLGSNGNPAALPLLLKAVNTLSPQGKNQAIQQLLSRDAWIDELLTAFDEGTLSPNALSLSQQSQLLNHTRAQVRQRVSVLFQTNSKRTEIVEQYKPAIEKLGDIDRGRVVFERACIACHRRGSSGNAHLGPDLATVIEHEPDQLLANILDPSRDIQPGYQAYYCQLKTGEQLFGLLASETASGIVIRQIDGSERSVLRMDIDSLRNANISLMPEGLENAMSPEAVSDLIAFLKGAPL